MYLIALDNNEIMGMHEVHQKQCGAHERDVLSTAQVGDA